MRHDVTHTVEDHSRLLVRLTTTTTTTVSAAIHAARCNRVNVASRAGSCTGGDSGHGLCRGGIGGGALREWRGLIRALAEDGRLAVRCELLLLVGVPLLLLQMLLLRRELLLLVLLQREVALPFLHLLQLQLALLLRVVQVLLLPQLRLLLQPLPQLRLARSGRRPLGKLRRRLRRHRHLLVLIVWRGSRGCCHCRLRSSSSRHRHLLQLLLLHTPVHTRCRSSSSCGGSCCGGDIVRRNTSSLPARHAAASRAMHATRRPGASA